MAAVAMRKRRVRQVRPAWEVPTAIGKMHEAVGSWNTARLVVRGAPDGLRAFDVESGSPRWSWIVPGRQTLLAMSRSAESGVGMVVYADEGRANWSADCTVAVISLQDGEPVWSQSRSFADAPWSHSADNYLQGIALVPDRARPVPATPLRLRDRQREVSVALDHADGGHRLAGSRRGRRCPDRYRRQLPHRPLPGRGGGSDALGGRPLDAPVDSVQLLVADPLVLLCRGRGRRGEDELLVLRDEDGQVTTRIPVRGSHGELQFDQYTRFGVADDEPATVVGNMLVALSRPRMPMQTT